jgi:hypothetical protein
LNELPIKLCRLIVSLFMVVSMVNAMTIHAQTTPQGIEIPQVLPDSNAPIDLKSMSPEQVMLYLASEKVAAAGVGFRNGAIGDPIASILNIWGEPKESRKTGILGSYEFLYQPDPHLFVVFTGKDTIKTISIRGSEAALFRTVRGARMGMPVQNLARLYGLDEVDVKNNHADFDKLGISFHFKSDRIYKVVIYQPED